MEHAQLTCTCPKQQEAAPSAVSRKHAAPAACPSAAHCQHCKAVLSSHGAQCMRNIPRLHLPPIRYAQAGASCRRRCEAKMQHKGANHSGQHSKLLAPEAGAATGTNACLHEALAACHSCVLVSSGASRMAQEAVCVRGMAALNKHDAADKRAAATAAPSCARLGPHADLATGIVHAAESCGGSPDAHRTAAEGVPSSHRQPSLQVACLQQCLTLSLAKFMTSAIVLRASLVSGRVLCRVFGNLQAHKGMLEGWTHKWCLSSQDPCACAHLAAVQGKCC